MPKQANDVFARLNIETLSNDVYLSRGAPITDPSQKVSRDPRLVIIFGWMDAPAPQVMSKYAVKHRDMYPNSDIVVAISRTGFMMWPEHQRQEQMRPLAEYVMQTIYTPQYPTGGVFLHTVSNGGALNLVIFSEVLHKLYAASSVVAGPRIRTSIILDSTPGWGEWNSAYTTFKIALGINKPGHTVTKGAVAVGTSALVAAGLLKNKMEGQEGLFTRLHTTLLREDILPRSTSTSDLIPRLYVYSTGDAMVPFQSVDGHLHDLMLARSLAHAEKGGRVWVRRMEGEAHLAGERALGKAKEMKGDIAELHPRYWDTVRALWESSAVYEAGASLEARASLEGLALELETIAPVAEVRAQL